MDANQWYLDQANGLVEWTLPYFEPGTVEGSAEWRIEDSVFVSRYPRGFEFSARAFSSGGEIVTASVVWSHAPNKLKRRDAEIKPDTGELYLRWFPDDDLPPWVAVNYYWSLQDSTGNRYRSEWFLGAEYEDNTDLWSRYESDEVIVVVQQGLPIDTATLTLQAMEDQEPTFEQAWGGRLSYKPRVILFADREDFAQWRVGFTGGIIGQTSDNWGATVQVITNNNIRNLTYGTVLHEIAHLYQFEYGGAAFPAGSWFTEGNATFFELYQEYDYEERVREFAENDQLPVLLQDEGPVAFASGPDNRGRFGYDVGYTFWHWMVMNYGLDAHRQVIEGLRAGLDRSQVLETVTGLDLDEIERRWRVWLGASDDVPRLVPTPTFRPIPPTVTPFQFPTAVPD
jgi:hypothetical protein